MATGRIKKLVHLSQQTYLPNARLVPDHNEKGYGVIEDEDGREVYFPHEVVASRHGFDDLRRGQSVEYTLENAPYLRANFVSPAPTILENVQMPAAYDGHIDHTTAGHVIHSYKENENEHCC